MFAMLKDAEYHHATNTGVWARCKYNIFVNQQAYDFDEGLMAFMSPGQVFGIEVEKDSILMQSGWMSSIHPDFLWNTPLAKTIDQYEYFTTR